jgi:hypothetical protein
MEAHQFCKQVNEDFAQCVLFDGNTSAANLNGIEYGKTWHVWATDRGDKLPLGPPMLAPSLPRIKERDAPSESAT